MKFSYSHCWIKFISWCSLSTNLTRVYVETPKRTFYIPIGLTVMCFQSHGILYKIDPGQKTKWFELNLTKLLQIWNPLLLLLVQYTNRQIDKYKYTNTALTRLTCIVCSLQSFWRSKGSLPGFCCLILNPRRWRYFSWICWSVITTHGYDLTMMIIRKNHDL